MCTRGALRAFANIIPYKKRIAIFRIIYGTLIKIAESNSVANLINLVHELNFTIAELMT